MDAAFFDTNILIYAFAKDDPRKQVALELMQAGGAISVQVLNEFATVAHRKLGFDWPAVADAIAAITVLCQPCTGLTVETNRAAIGLAHRYGYAFYDCLIIATALEHGCTTLWTEDMHHGQIIDERLRILNPFG